MVRKDRETEKCKLHYGFFVHTRVENENCMYIEMKML